MSALFHLSSSVQKIFVSLCLNGNRSRDALEYTVQCKPALIIIIIIMALQPFAVLGRLNPTQSLQAP
jgi:hypothetical protein